MQAVAGGSLQQAKRLFSSCELLRAEGRGPRRGLPCLGRGQSMRTVYSSLSTHSGGQHLSL